MVGGKVINAVAPAAKEDGIPEETEVECVLSNDNPKVGDCSVCKTSIWHKQGYMQDDDGKSYHIMCRVMQSSYEQIAALKAENAALLAKLAPVASLQELEGEPKPELVWRHLVKRMFDECGSTKAFEFIQRVESGEHDVPSPWSKSWEISAELRKLRSQESK